MSFRLDALQEYEVGFDFGVSFFERGSEFPHDYAPSRWSRTNSIRRCNRPIAFAPSPPVMSENCVPFSHPAVDIGRVLAQRRIRLQSKITSESKSFESRSWGGFPVRDAPEAVRKGCCHEVEHVDETLFVGGCKLCIHASNSAFIFFGILEQEFRRTVFVSFKSVSVSEETNDKFLVFALIPQLSRHRRQLRKSWQFGK